MGLFPTQQRTSVAAINSIMAEQMKLKGTLSGHTDWVTQIAAPSEEADVDSMILSSSRDKSIIVWDLKKTETSFGMPRRRLKGHGHFVSDVVISSDGQFALSGSWDKTLRLWEIQTGTSTRRFVGHTGDVLSVAFPPTIVKLCLARVTRPSSCG